MSLDALVMTLPVLEADHHGREHEHDHPPRKTEAAKADSGGAGSGTSLGAHLGTLPVSEADRTIHDAGPSTTATVVVPLLREPERDGDADTAKEDASQLESKTEEAAEPSSSGEVVSKSVLASVGSCSKSPTQSRSRARAEMTNARRHASTP
ncbi:hypothetical protein C8Q76DRAFT_698126 [Earliella scabrosa]|nr:hypothetical protein C8Q76DRAFT_698126 [Earliella scabrosa]